MASHREPSTARDTVFAAIVPDGITARRADEVTRRIYAEHGLDGKPRPLSQFHITVLYFGLHDQLGEEGIRRARLACEVAAGRTAPFEVRLDDAKSFPVPPQRSAPLVLLNEQRLPGFDACHETLLLEAKGMGLVTREPKKFIPHLTTAYSMKRLPPQPVDPISWKVTELLLIRSFVGRTKYEELGRWTLGA